MMIAPIIPIWGIALLVGVGFVWCMWQWWCLHSTMLAWRWMRRAGMVLLLAIMLLRPNLSGGTGVTGTVNVDVFMVIDTTGSMAAEDYTGGQTRLIGVGKDAKALIAKLAGAKYSVISFANDTYVELPLTTDAAAAQSAVDTLQPEITTYSSGSSISQPLDTLATQLKKAQENFPERKRFVYYFGDGEQTSDKSPTSFASIRQYVDGGMIFGYGTTAGGRMKEILAYDDGSTNYIKDRSNITASGAPDALSTINEDNLRAIASQLSIGYLYRGQGGDTSGLAGSTDFSKLTGNQTVDTREDLYWIAANGLVVLLGFEVWVMRRDIMAAYGPRRLK